jgi:restriction system protein
VRLIDGHKLHGLIQQLRRASSNEEVVTSELNDSLKTTIPSTAFLMPSCPLCSRPMARRVARKGSRAGSEFWGCTGFPGCRGTLPV